MELNDIKEVLNKGIEYIRSNPIELKKFQHLFLSITGTEFCLSCPEGLRSSWELLETIYIKKQKQMAGQIKGNIFQIKKDHLIYSVKQHKHFGIINTTDEDAIKLLREAEGNIVHFATYPDNWKDFVSGEVTLQDEKEFEAEQEANRKLEEAYIKADTDINKAKPKNIKPKINKAVKRKKK